MEKADVLFFLLDGKVGVTNEDRAIASYSVFSASSHPQMAPKEAEIAAFPDLRCSQQGTSFPRFHDQTEGVFSHTDDNGNCPPWEELKSEVYQLGLGEPVGVSAEHGEGLLDLFEVLQPFGDLINLNKAAERERYAKILEAKEAKASRSRQGYRVRTNVDMVESSGATDEKNTRDLDDEILQLTILGIPNSGKSTLLNTLLKTDRFITGSIPGLTRDTVSTEIEFHNRRIRVVDTPGIPKADGVLPPSLNSLSVFHAHKQLEYSHVVALILDGSRLLTKHDLALAKEVLDKGRGLFVILNKSDVMQSPAAAKKQLVQYMDRFVPQVGSTVALEVGWTRSLDRRFGTVWKGN